MVVLIFVPHYNRGRIKRFIADFIKQGWRRPFLPRKTGAVPQGPVRPACALPAHCLFSLTLTLIKANIGQADIG